MTHTHTLEESQRQAVLLAIAELSLRRPGWLHMLSEIAEELGGSVMFHNFRVTNADINPPLDYLLRPPAKCE